MFGAEIASKLEKHEVSGSFVFSYQKIPVSKVEIVGMVTKLMKKPKSIAYYVDDGTALIRCVQFINENDTAFGGSSGNAIAVGDVVTVLGMICLAETNEDDYQHCIRVSMIEVSQDPNHEVFHWLRTIQNSNSLLS